MVKNNVLLETTYSSLNSIHVHSKGLLNLIWHNPATVVARVAAYWPMSSKVQYVFDDYV